MAVTSYFTLDSGKFIPTDYCRGPWDALSCHAGPPTGLLARACEQAIEDQQLVRLTVELTRPVPMSGFEIQTTVSRRGRTVSTVDLVIVNLDGKQVLSARGSMITPQAHLDMPKTNAISPHFGDSVPGNFPVSEASHGLTSFADSCLVRETKTQGQLAKLGPNLMWLKTFALLADETPSAFQSICTLADCGNAISAPGSFSQYLYMNTDLTLSLFRAPVGQWFASDSISHWSDNGIGLSDSRLCDEMGVVGRATQSLLIVPRPPM